MVASVLQPPVREYYTSLGVRFWHHILARYILYTPFTVASILVAATASLTLTGTPVNPVALAVAAPLTLVYVEIGAVLAITVKRPELANLLASFTVYMLITLAPVFYPPEALPEPLRTLSQALPPTHTTAIITSLAQAQQPPPASLAYTLALTALLLLAHKRAEARTS